MKREYSSPVMEIEVFEASEYISSCITPSEIPPSKNHKLWQESNISPGLQISNDNGDKDIKLTGKICFENHKGLSATISNILSGYWHSEKGNSTENVEFYQINDREDHYHVYKVGNALNKVTNASQ